DFLAHAVPGHRKSMAAVDRACLREQELLVGLEGVAGAVPDVAALLLAVGDLVEAVEDPAVMREEAAGALGDQGLALGIVEVVEDLEGLHPRVLAGLVEGLVHVAEQGPLAE